jgi:hypothetical protein
MSDRQFLSDCGIAPLDAPTHDTVQIEIVMQGEFVRRIREKHVRSKSGQRRTGGCGHYDLGEISF